MAISALVLVAGILCGFADQAFGVRNWQGPMDTLRQRCAHAWGERRLTLVGSVLVLLAAGLDLAGA